MFNFIKSLFGDPNTWKEYTITISVLGQKQYLCFIEADSYKEALKQAKTTYGHINGASFK